jgi:hypothetical protein
MIKPADAVIFANPDLEEAYYDLSVDSPLRKSISRAIDDLKENVFCGDQIKKELIPKEYIKNFKIDNLWWYPLSDGWRLVYSIVSDKVELLAAIMEYFDHKEYERRFGYK